MRSSALASVLACALVACTPKDGSRTPLVEATIRDSSRGTRVSLRCRVPNGEAARLELDAGITSFGGRPSGPRAIGTVTRKDSTVTCVSGEGEKLLRSSLRLRPMQIRAVTPTVVRDQADARLVLTIDGQALSPRASIDDGVYLVWRGAILPMRGDCPEARVTDDRIVACVSARTLRGRGPARVRVQSAGRLEEAVGAPLDLASLLSAKGAGG